MLVASGTDLKKKKVTTYVIGINNVLRHICIWSYAGIIAQGWLFLNTHVTETLTLEKQGHVPILV